MLNNSMIFSQNVDLLVAVCQLEDSTAEGTGQPTLYGRDWNTCDTVEPWDPRKMQSASKEGMEW